MTECEHKIRLCYRCCKGTIVESLSQLTFMYWEMGGACFGSNEQFPVSALRAQGQTILVLPGEDIVREVHENIHQLADSLISYGGGGKHKAWADYTSERGLGETLMKYGGIYYGEATHRKWRVIILKQGRKYLKDPKKTVGGYYMFLINCKITPPWT